MTTHGPTNTKGPPETVFEGGFEIVFSSGRTGRTSASVQEIQTQEENNYDKVFRVKVQPARSLMIV